MNDHLREAAEKHTRLVQSHASKLEDDLKTLRSTNNLLKDRLKCLETTVESQQNSLRESRAKIQVLEDRIKQQKSTRVVSDADNRTMKIMWKVSVSRMELLLAENHRARIVSTPICLGDCEFVLELRITLTAIDLIFRSEGSSLSTYIDLEALTNMASYMEIHLFHNEHRQEDTSHVFKVANRKWKEYGGSIPESNTGADSRLLRSLSGRPVTYHKDGMFCLVHPLFHFFKNVCTNLPATSQSSSPSSPLPTHLAAGESSDRMDHVSSRRDSAQWTIASFSQWLQYMDFMIDLPLTGRGQGLKVEMHRSQ